MIKFRTCLDRRSTVVVVSSVLFLMGLFLGPSTMGIVDAAAVGLTEKKLYGVNYSMRQGPDWDEFKCQSPDQARAALRNLQSVTNKIRIFSVTDCDAAAILLGITQELNMGIWLGLWIAEDGLYFDQERNRLLELLESDGVSFDNVLGVHVSSEAIYRKELTAAQAIAYRDIIKQDFIDNNYPDIPIVVVDIVDNVIDLPQLIYAEEGVVMFNQFPIWSGKANINTAADYMIEEITTVESLAQGRQIIVGETGWADAGSNENANPATPSSYAKFLRDWICLANERNWQYFWFDAYDSDWRRVQDNLPNDVEGHFGLFNEDGQLKDYLQELLIDCSKPRTNIDPYAPTTPRPNAYSTTIPVSAPRPTTAVPTSAPSIPIENGDGEIDVAPSPTTLMPTTPAPTSAPTTKEVESEPTSPSPTTKPPISTTPPPDSTPDNQNSTSNNTTHTCQDIAECDALGLGGLCCPTPDNWTLDCCGPPYEPTCEDNAACAALGLEGACCPTRDGVYLDCCQSVPNECIEPGLCTKASAAEYTSKCELHSECQDLVGECCPTADGITLECCGVPVQEQCQSNDKCTEFGLEGACCPTIDGLYLDCCESLPNDCKNNSDSCPIVSALEYSQRQQSSSYAFTTIRTAWVMVLLSMVVPLLGGCTRGLTI